MHSTITKLEMREFMKTYYSFTLVMVYDFTAKTVLGESSNWAKCKWGESIFGGKSV